MTCPSCGYCPHCGRSGHVAAEPYRPQQYWGAGTGGLSLTFVNPAPNASPSRELSGAYAIWRYGDSGERIQ